MPSDSIRPFPAQRPDLKPLPLPRARAGRTRARVLAAALAAAATLVSAQSKKVTYEDDVLPILRDNCLKCHNPDKLKGDLDLTSFSSAIKGGGSGVTLNAGDPDGSQLFKSITHAEEPTMPPNAKLADKDIATIRTWIAGGLLQGVNSRALTASRPAVDLALKASSAGKPEGPPPLPGRLPLEPFVRAPHRSALSAIAHSPWAPVVALTGAKQVVLYHTTDLEFVGVLPFPEGTPCDLKFSRNGKLLLAAGGRGGHSGLVAVWDITTGERVITIGDQFDSVIAADLSADQQWIALGGPDRVLKIYRTKDGSLQHRIKKHTEWVTAVEYSPDSKFLATGDRNGGLVLWEAESGQEMFSLPGHKGAITAITWRGDSAVCATASEDGTVKFWKASDGAALRSLTAHPGGALCARFTHDGRLVTSGRDNKIQIWDTTGKNLLALSFKGDLPNRVTFSDDGRRVIGSDWQGQVLVWDAKTGQAIGELESNPPTLAERVQLNAERLAALQTEAKKAAAVEAAAVAEAKAAQAKLAQARQRLAAIRASLATKQTEARKAAAVPAKDESLQGSSADLRTAITSLETQAAALQKEISALSPPAAARAKKAAEAQKQSEAAASRLAAAQSSLAKWKYAQQAAGAKAGPRKVSLR